MRLPKLERKASGFTLVEMAIVLVIIGIILAGVMKGRDIVRGAQVKQFSQQFAQKWGTLAQTYYDKTGQQLNDGGRNGGLAGTAPDGIMDGNAPVRAFVAAVANGDQGIIQALNSVGIPACTLIKSKLVDVTAANAGPTGAPTALHCGGGATINQGNIFQTTVDGEYAGGQTVSVDLVGTGLTYPVAQYQRNMVVLYNVPLDVARGLDTAIDGREEGQTGSCVNLGAAAGGANAYAAGAANGGAVNINTQWTTLVWGPAQTNNLQCTTVGIVLDF